MSTSVLWMTFYHLLMAEVLFIEFIIYSLFYFLPYEALIEGRKLRFADHKVVKTSKSKKKNKKRKEHKNGTSNGTCEASKEV